MERADFGEERTARYKSKRFAIRVVHLYQHLCREKNEYTLSKQFLRSGTSIGANLAEPEEYKTMYADCKELQKMLSATTRTLQTQLVSKK